ncbi:CAAX prenyl protease 1 homolog [Teleopsis dalmanni]|uniref:CAAX prenyl protease 1 homolog n=1 Tax=Teleopsis dalmanni TaxID=139649 RepID=UPI0018CD1E7D|nr:CAAX prenyl protease 1 homolog [Teleopsis dalmanni]XP_037949653.1 CAAX prenyl protease 1 homolog [Teleopsis dalmanni]XP_037949654.1 CAAX prenyl protease 1 homolog [Teleopsis dalmanni]
MDSLPAAEVVLYSIIALIIVENLFEVYLSWRQVRVFKTALEVPKELKGYMNDDTFQKSRLYGLDREVFSIYKTILFDIIIVCLEIYFGFIAFAWKKSEAIVQYFNLNAENEIIVSVIFVVLTSILSIYKEIPLKVYKTFVLEAKHGFNKQTPGFFIWDQCKGFIVSQILMTPITAAIIYIVQIGGDHFFIWLWAFAGAISLLLLTIYPIFIAPLFDKYTPLEEGPLRQSIEDLAAKLKFPLTKLYVVEGSKRSSHSNAYFYGLWNSKRIVLFDTLLLNKGKPDDSELSEDEKGKGCTNEEVLAVLGHELGHWKLGHVTKNIIIMQAHLLLIIFIFGYCFKYPPFYEALGFEPGTRPILVGLLVVFSYVLAPYNAIVSFGMTVLSRRFEYQADEFGQKLGYADQLGRALIKLNLDNLGFPIHDWLYSSWNHSHPTLLQRLARLKELEANNKHKKTN